MVNNRLTSNREELETAVRSVKASSDPGELTRELRQWPRFLDIYEAYRIVRNERAYEPGASTMVGVVASRACRDQPDQCSGGGGGGRSMVEAQVQSKATQLVAVARLTGRQTFATITALSNGLVKLPGRKTLIMLTEGFFAEDEWADLRDVVARAARASVRIYAIDTRGLNRGSASSDIVWAANPAQPETLVAVDGRHQRRRAEQPGGGHRRLRDPERERLRQGVRRESTATPAATTWSASGRRGRRTGSTTEMTVSVKRTGVDGAREKGLRRDRSPIPVRVRTSRSARDSRHRLRPLPRRSRGLRCGSPPVGGGVRRRPGRPRPAGVPPAAGAAVPAAQRRARPAGAVRVTGQSPRTSRPSRVGAVGSLAATAGRRRAVRGVQKAGRATAGRPTSEATSRRPKALRRPSPHPAAPPGRTTCSAGRDYAVSEYAAATAQWEQVRSAVPQFEAVLFRPRGRLPAAEASSRRPIASRARRREALAEGRGGLQRAWRHPGARGAR